MQDVDSLPAHNVAILVPAFDPDEQLVLLVDSLVSNGFAGIFVVDDGSKNKEIFQSIAYRPEVTMVTHSENRGKGAALKTGFDQIINRSTNENFQSIISVDADGQHTTEDILAISEAAIKSPQSLILGIRDFLREVPLRSSFGNWLTRKVLRAAENIDLKDTQTGLRAIPLRLASESLKICANRYEFELECILLADKLNIDIQEVPIATIYLEDNASSHFRPIVDSMKIYAIFSRFIVISFTSFLIDIAAFALAYSATSDVFISTYVARSVSSIINFFGNKYIVFRSLDRREVAREALSYFLLVVFIATASAFLVESVNSVLDKNVLLVKIGVDLFLFCTNFLMQKHVLFKAAN